MSTKKRALVLSVTAYRSMTPVTSVDDLVLTEYPEKNVEHDE